MSLEPCPGCGRLVLSKAGVLERINDAFDDAHDSSVLSALNVFREALQDLANEIDCGLGCVARAEVGVVGDLFVAVPR